MQKEFREKLSWSGPFISCLEFGQPVGKCCFKAITSLNKNNVKISDETSDPFLMSGHVLDTSKNNLFSTLVSFLQPQIAATNGLTKFSKCFNHTG